MKKLTKIGLLCAVFVLVAVFAKIEYSKSRANVVTVLVSTPQQQNVDIGSHGVESDGQRAAIQELSRQFKAHPTTAFFQIKWQNDKQSQLSYRRRDESLAYIRQDFPKVRWIVKWKFPFVSKVVETSFASLTFPCLKPVTEKEIHRAAKQNASFDEMQTKWLAAQYR